MRTIVSQEAAPFPKPSSAEPLLRFLQTAGSTALDPRTLIPLVQACFEDFEGSDSGAMAAYKLSRMERPLWDPPVLRFDIERHGITVLGSKYAQIQGWELDFKAGVATSFPAGRRLVQKRDAPLDVKRLADDVFDAIVSRRDHAAIRWHPNGRVCIRVGAIIPETNKQTTQGRRKRFWSALDTRMAERHWQRAGRSYFQPAPATSCDRADTQPEPSTQELETAPSS